MPLRYQKRRDQCGQSALTLADGNSGAVIQTTTRDSTPTPHRSARREAPALARQGRAKA
jgi:hypothetical protein